MLVFMGERRRLCVGVWFLQLKGGGLTLQTQSYLVEPLFADILLHELQLLKALYSVLRVWKEFERTLRIRIYFKWRPVLRRTLDPHHQALMRMNNMERCRTVGNPQASNNDPNFMTGQNIYHAKKKFLHADRGPTKIKEPRRKHNKICMK